MKTKVRTTLGYICTAPDFDMGVYINAHCGADNLKLPKTPEEAKEFFSPETLANEPVRVFRVYAESVSP